MKIEQSEIKDLTAVITMTVEPADYQEAVQKNLSKFVRKPTSQVSVQVWHLRACCKRCTARASLLR